MILRVLLVGLFLESACQGNAQQMAINAGAGVISSNSYVLGAAQLR